MHTSTECQSSKMIELQQRYKAKYGTDAYQKITIAETDLEIPSDRFMGALAAMIEYYEKKEAKYEDYLSDIRSALRK